MNDQNVSELERLQLWVDDLQSGMYINCVYCGYRYGPADEVPATMADALKQHIEQCPKHPMSALKEQNRKLLALLEAMQDDMRSYLPPDSGHDAEWFVNRMLMHLDGPQQRDAQGTGERE